MADDSGKLQLVVIAPKTSAPASFVFKYFPRSIRTDDRANWEAQDVTIGVKPLFYANREPRRVSFDELWLDVSDGLSAFDSVTPEIEALRDLMTETRAGVPPTLRLIWGNRQETVVIEQLSIEEQFPFARNGNPMRAKVSLQLLELQEIEEVTSTVNDNYVPSGP